MIAHINKIATAVPGNDVHDVFVQFARSLLRDDRSRLMFDRMLQKSGIEHRWSCQVPSAEGDHTTIDGNLFLHRGTSVSTAARMRVYEQEAPTLAAQAVDALGLGEEIQEVTHLVIASCTGFAAPGLDLQLIDRFGMSPSVERTVVGFMGCYAAINALKLAHHIVRSEPQAKVIVICVELCSLHFHQTSEIDQVLMFLLFGDGCAAALVSAEPSGLAIDSFHASVIPGTAELMSWHIRDHGFDMVLSGDVPRSVYRGLRSNSTNILGGASVDEFSMWAVHPGGSHDAGCGRKCVRPR